MNDEFRQDSVDPTPIYIKTKELGPHRERVAFVEDSTYHSVGVGRALIWGVASIIIGASAMNFIFYFKDEIQTQIIGAPNQNNNVVALASPDLQEKGGSDDLASTTQSDFVAAQAIEPATTTGQYYFLDENNKAPRVQALSYAVVDLDNGESIISKNPDSVLPPASVTKLLTSVVAIENNKDFPDKLIVNASALSPINTEGELSAGQKFYFTDLLYPLLMESSNDAAEVYAQNYNNGRTAFIGLMNSKAKNIGMVNTGFVEPSGVSHENYTTSNSLIKLGEYVYKNHPEILAITRVKQYAISGHIWLNPNRMMGINTFLGGKNGFTDAAQETTVTFLNIPVGKVKRNILLVIMMSPDRKSDGDTIVRFIENNMGYSDTVNLDQ